MGIDSDFTKAKTLFPNARSNCVYKSWDFKNKSDDELRKDFEFIANNLGPCDIGFPDIEVDVPDQRIRYALDLCSELSDKYLTEE